MSDLDDMNAERRMREHDHLNLRIADFIRRYKPKDEYDVREVEAELIEAELIEIIRMAHMQATESFARNYAAMEACCQLFLSLLKNNWTD